MCRAGEERVGDTEKIARLVNRAHFADGKVMPANLMRKELHPDRPSAYSLARVSVQELEAANPPWCEYGLVILEAHELRALGLELCITPNECQFQSICHGHVSLENVKREVRDDVVDLFNLHIFRPPRQSDPP